MGNEGGDPGHGGGEVRLKLFDQLCQPFDLGFNVGGGGGGGGGLVGEFHPVVVGRWGIVLAIGRLEGEADRCSRRGDGLGRRERA